MMIGEPSEAAKFLKNGKIITYPTECIYGIGCDPFNEDAVNKIYQIKKREKNKPMIIVASEIEQIGKLVDITLLTDNVKKSWPGNNTWIIPSLDSCPKWLVNEENRSVAIRVSSHPVISQICRAFSKPIISTSANISLEKPIKKFENLLEVFEDKIDFFTKGELGDEVRPSVIREMQSGKILRK